MTKELKTKLAKLKKRCIGKLGYVVFGGLQVNIKVTDVRFLAGREQVEITPGQGRGSVWKYLVNVKLK